MDFLIERIDDTKVVIEEGTIPGEKNFFIEGNFIQTNIKNRNGRVYPKPIMENAVRNYQSVIDSKRAMGELGHPNTPTTNLDKVSHIIESLKFNGDNVIGRARLLDTPMGKIAKTLVKEGVKLGVSTRGVGTVKESVVQHDFNLITVDIVADPSGPDCFVNSIMENLQWVYENGILIEKEIKKDINEAYKYQISKKEREEKILILFNKYLKTL
jgi:hypothetical protein